MNENIFNEKEYPNCYGGYQYLLDVLDGKIVTNIYIRSLCAKVKKDFQDDRFYFDVEWAEKFMFYFQKFEHVIGEWTTPNIVLEGWQKFFFMCVEGFYWKHNNKRKYKTAHKEVARGNGKSAECSVTGLIYLCLHKVVKGNKVFSAATKTEQARIVLDSARQMARVNKSFLNGTGTKVYAHHIYHQKTDSEFRALSSDSKSLDGLQPILGIVDELHAHKDRFVYDVIDSAMSKRPDSMLLVITTAGFSLEGIGYSQSNYAKKVALGEIKDESFFPMVYTLDDGDDWKDENNWIKANPNFGVSVDPDTFRSKALKAIANPADEVNFKVKHLNLWQNASSQFFNIKLWKECADKTLRLEDFVGKRCYIGIDLASNRDITSMAYVFKENGKFYIFTRNFCPEMAIEESRNVFYKEWVDGGYLIKTNGNALNYDLIESDLEQTAKPFIVESAHYDSWNAQEFAQNMTKKKFNMLDFRMNTSNLSEPMKKLDSAILEGNVVHDGNECTTWCISNVVAKRDHNDNVFPRKEHESMKIDPAVAIIMAVAGWVNEENEQSVYEERGMIFI